MRYPEFLREGGKIGFIAPSFGAAAEPYYTAFGAALERFREMGYETVLGPNCYADCGVGKSNTPEACAAEINEFFLQEKSDIIISCGGGETMCEDLPFVDFAGITAARPKWYLGYSDNTNLTYTLPVLTDTAAVYGYCASSFGMQPWHESIADTFSLLKGEKLRMKNYDRWQKEDAEDAGPTSPYNLTEDYCMTVFDGEKILSGNAAKSVRFSGRLIGGCLDCLIQLCGTRFDGTKDFLKRYEKDGIIWYLEACDLGAINVRRALWQLEQSGWFDGAVRGFLIGRPWKYDDEFMGLDRIGAVLSVLEKYKVPVILDTDFGHCPPRMPLISGSVAEVTAAGNRLTVDMKLIE